MLLQCKLYLLLIVVGVFSYFCFGIANAHDDGDANAVRFDKSSKVAPELLKLLRNPPAGRHLQLRLNRHGIHHHGHHHDDDGDDDIPCERFSAGIDVTKLGRKGLKSINKFLLVNQRCMEPINILPGWDKHYQECECPIGFTCFAYIAPGEPIHQKHYRYYCQPNNFL